MRTSRCRERNTCWRRYVVKDRYDEPLKKHNLAIDNKGEGGLTAILDHYDYLRVHLLLFFFPFTMPKSPFSLGFFFFTTIQWKNRFMWHSLIKSVVSVHGVCNCKACWTRFRERKMMYERIAALTRPTSSIISTDCRSLNTESLLFLPI